MSKVLPGDLPIIGSTPRGGGLSQSKDGKLCWDDGGTISQISGTMVSVSPYNSAEENTAIIQAALDAKGDVVLSADPGSVILINKTLVIGSNTRLSIAPGVTIRAGATIGNLLTNYSWTLTPSSVTATWATTTSRFVTVTLTAHGLVVGDYVWLRGATDPAFRGCFRVKTVTDANTFDVELWRTSPTSATGAIAGTLTATKADTNIEIVGGTWDYQYVALGNGASNTTAHTIIMAGVAGLTTRKIRGADTRKFLLCAAGVVNGRMYDTGGILNSDTIKNYGPLNNVWIDGVDSYGGDDLCTFQQAESTTYIASQVGDGGDVINCGAKNISGHSDTRAVSLYVGNITQGIVDGCEFSNVSAEASGSAIVAIDGVAGSTAEIGVTTLRNIQSRINGPINMIVIGEAGPVNLKSLLIESPSMISKSVSGKVIVMNPTASTAEISVNGGYVQDIDQIMSVAAGVLKVNAVFKGFRAKNLWGTLSLRATSSNVKFDELSFEGSTIDTFVNCNTASTSTDISISDSTISAPMTSFARLANGANIDIYLKNVDFSGAITKFIDTASGASVINIRAENVKWPANPVISVTGTATPTINSWGEGLVVDVALLSLTAGQTAWHSSTVAGRNAANQQGPAFCNGTNWYARGTGAGGVNTLIV